MLSNALIRSKLEYALIMWYTVYQTYIASLDAVQRKILRFLCFLADCTYPSRGFDQTILLSRSNFTSLDLCRSVCIIKFLRNTLNNKIDWSYLLNKTSFLVPRANSRNSLTFLYPFAEQKFYLKPL